MRPLLASIATFIVFAVVTALGRIAVRLVGESGQERAATGGSLRAKGTFLTKSWSD
jgi:hypothetical protein